MTTRKLKHYFLAHTVWVVSDRPLARTLQSKEATGRIAQWAMEIRQCDVKFVPRRAIKSQTLTNFIAEWTNSDVRGIGDLPDHWVMYFDGSYTLKGAGAGIVLIPPECDMIKYDIQIEFCYQQHHRIRGAGHRASASQGAWHSVTPHPGRLSARGQTCTKRVRLQRR
jgi:hypothetical protein